MRILITGAASFLGSHLVDYFLDKGDEVLALARKNAVGTERLLKHKKNPKFKELILDIRNAEEIDENFDVCIHLAWGGVGKTGRMDRNIQNENVEAAKKLIRVCKEKKAKRMLFAGSQAEYGRTLEDIQKQYGNDFDIKDIALLDEDAKTFPKSEYGKAKLMLKRELKSLGDSLGIEYVHMRIFSVFGDGDHETSLISSCLNNFIENKDVHIGECRQSWNYIYVKDFCQAVYLLAKKDLGSRYVFNVAGEKNRILMDYVNDMKEILKSKSNIIVEEQKVTGEGLPFLNPNISALKQLGFEESYGFEGGIIDICKHL